MKRFISVLTAVMLSFTMLSGCKAQNVSVSSQAETTTTAETKPTLSPEDDKKLHDEVMSKSSNYMKLIPFADLKSFKVTSEDLNDYVWDDVITNTLYGKNKSPDLKWEAVEGATQYIVLMLDSDWLHMDVFTTETSISAGSIKSSKKGSRYVGPYPPVGTHTYSVFVFALKDEPKSLPYTFNSGGNYLAEIFPAFDTDKSGNMGNVIAYGRLDGNYTHRD